MYGPLKHCLIGNRLRVHVCVCLTMHHGGECAFIGFIKWNYSYIKYTVAVYLCVGVNMHTQAPLLPPCTTILTVKTAAC